MEKILGLHQVLFLFQEYVRKKKKINFLVEIQITSCLTTHFINWLQETGRSLLPQDITLQNPLLWIVLHPSRPCHFIMCTGTVPKISSHNLGSDWHAQQSHWFTINCLIRACSDGKSLNTWPVLLAEFTHSNYPCVASDFNSGFTDDKVIRTCALMILFSITYLLFPYFNFVQTWLEYFMKTLYWRPVIIV